MAYSSIAKPSDHFNTVLYTGNGSTQSITGVGFQPDWVWLKVRTQSYSHRVFDSVRGANKRLYPNTNEAEDSPTTALTSFDSDGFSLGSDTGQNQNTDTFVSWNWKAGGASTSTNSDGDINGTQTVNQTAGFSVTTYNGNGGSNQSLGHGLGATPKIYINKRRDNTGQWLFVTTIIDGSLDYLFLETTGAKSNSSRTAPTSSVVYLENGGDANESGGTHVMYAFSEKQGYSKFITYTGNGNADGAFIHTGFKPAVVIIKKSSASGSNWRIHDNRRLGYNGGNNELYINTNGTEGPNRLDILSNGIKIITTDTAYNASGETYVCMAFAENPFVGNDSGTAVPGTAR